MSRVGVLRVNAVVDQLRTRKVGHIVLQEPVSTFRLSNKIRVYNQAQLRRCLHLLEAAHQLINSGYGLAAMNDVRGIFETIANYHAVSTKIFDLIAANTPLADIYRQVHLATLATRNPNMIGIAETEDVKPINVLTQIDKMTKIRPSYRKEYDFLCEYVHGNATGSIIYFGHDDQKSDVVTFSDIGPDPHHELKWVLIAGYLLEYLRDDMDRLEATLPALSARGHSEALLHQENAAKAE